MLIIGEAALGVFVFSLPGVGQDYGNISAIGVRLRPIFSRVRRQQVGHNCFSSVFVVVGQVYTIVSFAVLLVGTRGASATTFFLMGPPRLQAHKTTISASTESHDAQLLVTASGGEIRLWHKTVSAFSLGQYLHGTESVG